jgi:hypothetical protein
MEYSTATDHETSQWLICLTQPPIVICRGGDMSYIIRSCHCDEFRPYRLIREEGDEEAFEEQNLETEVIRK